MVQLGLAAILMGLASPAWADEAGAEEVPSEEITVVAETRVADARAAVVDELDRLGWKAIGRNKAGDTLFRPPEVWMGRVKLTPHGLLEFRRKVVALGAVEPEEREVVNEDRDAPGGSGVAAQVYVAPSKNRGAAARAQVVAELADELSALRDALAAAAAAAPVNQEDQRP
jgi:hypothetical protein